jgi:histidine triad (HIT) family protein
MANAGDFDFYCDEALTGKTLTKKLYESDTVLAFYHTNPSYEKHIVIIPKEHIHDLLHITQEHIFVMVEIVQVAQKLAKELDIENKGARFITNMGKFQDTPHLHFHLISGNSIR